MTIDGATVGLMVIIRRMGSIDCRVIVRELVIGSSGLGKMASRQVIVNGVRSSQRRVLSLRIELGLSRDAVLELDGGVGVGGAKVELMEIVAGRVAVVTVVIGSRHGTQEAIKCGWCRQTHVWRRRGAVCWSRSIVGRRRQHIVGNVRRRKIVALHAGAIIIGHRETGVGAAADVVVVVLVDKFDAVVVGDGR